MRVLLSFDFEWSLIKDKYGEHPILAAGFVDSNGVKSAFLIEDFIDKEVSPERQTSRAEKALLLKIVRVINRYDWSIGFYSTGIRAYNQWKKKTVGRDSDLIQLHRRLERYGIMSIVRQGRFSQIPYLAGYNNTHTHIDTYRLFTNQAIKVSVYGNSYSANDLDTIGKAIVKRGKYDGLSGHDFEAITDLEQKHNYVLEDAQLLMDCVSHNNYELLHIINSISKLTGVSFRDVCNARGTTKIWTQVLDRMIEKALVDVEETISNNLVAEDDKNNYYFKRHEKLVEYYKRPNFKVVEEEFDEEDDDADENDDNKEDDEGRARYIGGLVIKPEPGEYRDVRVFDVASLYPNKMVEYNLSFDTVNCSSCKDNLLAKVPSQIFDGLNKDWHVCVRFDGILPAITREFMQKRLEYKALAKAKEKYTESELRGFQLKSQAYKILLNSGYGLMGYRFAKYENLEAAELVTRYGRDTIKQIRKIASDMFGWDSIYGDTDSIFATASNMDLFSEANVNFFLDTCHLQLNVTLELDKIFERLVIVGKKNYVGITDSNRIIVKGLAGKKSDRCLWVRQAFNQMLEDYKNRINPCINIRLEIEKLETAKLQNIQGMLLMRKNLGKNPEEYQSNVIQKLIGIEKGLQEGDTANYYLSDNEVGYTYDPNEYSVREYKDQLVHSLTPFLTVLGYEVKKDLDIPSESLAGIVRAARAHILSENIGSKRNLIIKRKLILEQKQHHRKQGALIKI